ncbi:MAG: hypothetical protein ACRDOK_17445 [Streptosporangiaceae bacterium]
MSVNAARTTGAQLAATRHPAGLTAAAGPFSAAAATLNSRGIVLPSTIIIGRASPGGSLDDLTLVTGHWPWAATSDRAVGGLGLPSRPRHDHERDHGAG